MKPIRCIAAMDSKRGIGKNNQLPWKLKKEMGYFNKISTSVTKPGHKNAVIMGRRSWNSIPAKYRPLPDRLNIVLSKTLCSSDVPNDVAVKPTLKDAMEHIETLDGIEHVFAIGGYSVYKEAIEMPLCDRIYLTHVSGDFGCDAFFPELSENLYKRASDPDVPEGIQEENGIQYEFCLYQRQQ